MVWGQDLVHWKFSFSGSDICPGLISIWGWSGTAQCPISKLNNNNIYSVPQVLTYSKETVCWVGVTINISSNSYLAITDDIDHVVQYHYINVGMVDKDIKHVCFLELCQVIQVRNDSLKGLDLIRRKQDMEMYTVHCTGAALFVFSKNNWSPLQTLD